MKNQEFVYIEVRASDSEGDDANSLSLSFIFSGYFEMQFAEIQYGGLGSQPDIVVDCFRQSATGQFLYYFEGVTMQDNDQLYIPEGSEGRMFTPGSRFRVTIDTNTNIGDSATLTVTMVGKIRLPSDVPTITAGSTLSDQVEIPA